MRLVLEEMLWLLTCLLISYMHKMWLQSCHIWCLLSFFSASLLSGNQNIRIIWSLKLLMNSLLQSRGQQRLIYPYITMLIC